MGKVIEVYVKNTIEAVGTVQGYYPLTTHDCTKTPATFAKLERILPEADKNALDLSATIAREKSLKLKVYNVSTFRGKFMAQLKGVKKTPTVIIENNRIDDMITKDKLLSAL